MLQRYSFCARKFPKTIIIFSSKELFSISKHNSLLLHHKKDLNAVLQSDLNFGWMNCILFYCVSKITLKRLASFGENWFIPPKLVASLGPHRYFPSSLSKNI